MSRQPKDPPPAEPLKLWRARGQKFKKSVFEAWHQPGMVQLEVAAPLVTIKLRLPAQPNQGLNFNCHCIVLRPPADALCLGCSYSIQWDSIDALNTTVSLAEHQVKATGSLPFRHLTVMAQISSVDNQIAGVFCLSLFVSAAQLRRLKGM